MIQLPEALTVKDREAILKVLSSLDKMLAENGKLNLQDIKSSIKDLPEHLQSIATDAYGQHLKETHILKITM